MSQVLPLSRTGTTCAAVGHVSASHMSPLTSWEIREGLGSFFVKICILPPSAPSSTGIDSAHAGPHPPIVEPD